MPRRTQSSAGLNLDSLMDTLTNVVGFLLILLALMKLGVGEVVERIQAIDPTALGVREEDVVRAKSKEEMQAAELEYLRRRAKALESDLKLLMLPTDARQPENKIELPKISPDAARRQLDDLKKKSATLEKGFATEDAESARLKALLAKVPLPAGVPGKAVTLPNSRPAPKESQPAYVFCVNGRVMFLDVAGMQKYAVSRITDLWGRMNLRWQQPGTLVTTIGPQPAKKKGARPSTRVSPKAPQQQEILYDPAKVAALFKQQQIGNHDYRLFIRTYDDRAYGNLEFAPQANGGETIEQMKLPSSRYRAALRSIVQNRNYVRFMVNTNSFETYAEARSLSEQFKIPAGWEIVTSPTYLASLGTDVKFHQKIIPPPAPPPPPLPPGAKPPPPPNVLD